MSAILSRRASEQLRHTYDSRVRSAILDTIENDLSTRESERITEWRWRRTVVPQYVILVPDPADVPDTAFDLNSEDVPTTGPLAILYRRLNRREVQSFAELGQPDFYVMDIFSVVMVMAPLLPADISASPPVPAALYLSSADRVTVADIVQRLEAVALAFDFSVVPQGDVELQSWFRRFRLKLRRAATSEEVTQRLEKLERALQVAVLDRPQSEVDVNQAEAVGKLLAGLQGIDSAVVRVGSMVLVKSTGDDGRAEVQARPLTVAELNYLEQHPELLKQPPQVVPELSGISGPAPARTAESKPVASGSDPADEDGSSVVPND